MVSRSSQPASPVWTKFIGAISMLLILEFWVHMLVPYLRRNVPYPWWPTGTIIDLTLSTVLAGVAATRGSRLWWASAACAVGTLVLLIAMFAG
jgi:hypothetical protein